MTLSLEKILTPTPTPRPSPFTVRDLHERTAAFWRTNWDWLTDHWLEVLVAVTIGVAIFSAVHFVKALGRRLCRRDETGKGWYTILGSAIAKTGNLFIILLAARLVSGIGQAPEQVTQIIRFLFTISAVFQGAVWTREIILGAIEYRTSIDDYHGEALMNAMGLIRLLVTFVVFAIALVLVLDNLGVNVTGLIAGLGVGGIAIGLAAQGIFADLFAALAIIFDQPFRRGDAISYDSSSGTVEAIGLKSTRIRGLNGEERIISNKNLLDKEIINNTQRQRRRIKFAIGLIYQTPVEQAQGVPDLLREIVEAHRMQFVRSGFVGFGDSSINFELEFDSPEAAYETAYGARHAIGLAILDRFNKDGLEFAYPTQTSFTSAPDGTMIMPYPEVQPVRRVDLTGDAKADNA